MVLWALWSVVAVAGPRKKQAPPEPPPPAEAAQEAPSPKAMTNDGIHAFLVGVFGEGAAELRLAPNQWSFQIQSVPVMILTDENADRMRIMAPIGDAAGLPDGLAVRMLQANFDAVLDARYAIGRGQVWSTFIHPLSPLDEDQLASGLAQTVTAALTFGTTFSGGAMVFGGGDSGAIYEELLKQLKPPPTEESI